MLRFSDSFFKTMWENQNKYYKKEDSRKRKKQMMMTMKKMKMMMMMRGKQDNEELLISSPSSLDPESLIWSPSSPDLRPRRNVIRRIVDVVADLARSVTAAVSGTPDVPVANNIGRTNHVTEDEFVYDARKCVVGSERTYCRNCRRYHHALLTL